MALFMTLLVRDEEDILDANLRYHLEQGVDHVIVTDNLSVDRSAEIVRSYVDQGVATYLHEPDNTYAQSKWVSRMAAMAHAAGARWIIHSDADEFWMPPGKRSLKRWFAQRRWHNIVSAPRHDFICLEDDGAPFWQRMIYRKAQSTNPLGRPLPPKVAHRAAANLVVAQGNHAVAGFRWPRCRTSDLEILHFPLRSRAQYIRKIENGGKAYSNNTDLDPAVGATWRRQYAELQETSTLAFVEENIISDAALQRLLSEGAALRDTRLADFFAERG
jgi:glycosyltransferase involved in cell wall biosynthesis